ncbi:hypothetical protein N658DRAFT_434779 [Parathielavia hyrcaniae]|uniref:Uncharacterized protein n=1 Tax=Parathielavia hyrcaniae TaxID=113614 RepID=A0AAN6SX39_9PEZI|nr:hypothetical protein N658DRAFT_434779 [Parathielavia hyrcaniae]
MASKRSAHSVTSESAPLIKPVDCESDQDLFMVPLKRPSPRLPVPSSPNHNTQGCPQPDSQLDVNPHQSPSMSGVTVKPDSPPMFTSPLMSPDSGALAADGSPNMQGSAGQHSMGTPESLAYNSPPMSGSNQQAGLASIIMSPEAGSAGQSPPQQSSTRENTTAASRSTGKKSPPSTKASSVYDNDNLAVMVTAQDKAQPGPSPDTTASHHQQTPELPPLSAARALKSPATTVTPTTKPATLGLALHLHPTNPNPSPNPNTNFLAPPHPLTPYPQAPNSPLNWTVPDSPLDRLSQLRATPDSAYDRARQMEVRRSEWKHVVYRFPVAGAADWVVDADLTESSHARLADVARRSSEGFAWNGDYELANVYRVLSAAHGRVMEEMRGERRGGAAGATRSAGG